MVGKVLCPDNYGMMRSIGKNQRTNYYVQEADVKGYRGIYDGFVEEVQTISKYRKRMWVPRKFSKRRG
jgi:hypothetical protein